jgi:hypothetical protein
MRKQTAHPRKCQVWRKQREERGRSLDPRTTLHYAQGGHSSRGQEAGTQAQPELRKPQTETRAEGRAKRGGGRHAKCSESFAALRFDRERRCAPLAHGLRLRSRSARTSFARACSRELRLTPTSLRSALRAGLCLRRAPLGLVLRPCFLFRCPQASPALLNQHDAPTGLCAGSRAVPARSQLRGSHRSADALFHSLRSAASHAARASPRAGGAPAARRSWLVGRPPQAPPAGVGKS